MALHVSVLLLDSRCWAEVLLSYFILVQSRNPSGVSSLQVQPDLKLNTGLFQSQIPSSSCKIITIPSLLQELKGQNGGRHGKVGEHLAFSRRLYQGPCLASSPCLWGIERTQGQVILIGNYLEAWSQERGGWETHCAYLHVLSKYVFFKPRLGSLMFKTKNLLLLFLCFHYDRKLGEKKSQLTRGLITINTLG